MEDYVVLIWPALAEAPARDLIRRLPKLKTVIETSGLVVLRPENGAGLRVGGNGVVLGSVFRTGGDRETVAEFSESEASAIATSRGQQLVTEFWGGYLAVLGDASRSEVMVLRDPSGAMPAYCLVHGEVQIICSRLEVLEDAGLGQQALNWDVVAQLLAFPNLRGRSTGLKGVEELLPGCRLTFTGGLKTETLTWNPWLFARPSAQAPERGVAATAVRQAVEVSVRKWADQSSPVLLELSGGLDSSIIACCLDEPRTAATFVNFVTPTAEGDERGYARLVAKAADKQLIEQDIRADEVDVTRPRPGRHPRPASQALLQPLEQACAELAPQLGARSFFSGLGGDNVFCSIATASPAADALLTSGLGRQFWAAIGDLCARHNCTVWAALSATLKKLLRSDRRLVIKPNLDFLSFREDAIDRPDHPWLEVAADRLPGKREHVASILLAQGFLDRYEHAQVAAVRFPLLTQPVMEACLRVPTWMANHQGRNRAVARDAFFDRLPPRVRDRQTKGGLNAFMGVAFERNRQALARHLLDGRLVQRGLIDAVAIKSALASPVLEGGAMNRLLYLADVESWVRSWEDV
uniref:asparagine synthase (glutamine-hydrolyzing) n=1 Tax=Caulobacter sp. (strain K31) TaxID=366602 RepID=B0T9D6_CAUSK